MRDFHQTTDAMLEFLSISRREFFRSTATALASSFCLPWLLRRKPDSSSWFIHADTGAIWIAGDPVRWCLDNTGHPVLDRAADGLRKLTADDSYRIIRLVTRRCRLNLIEIAPSKVVVSYWSQTGMADMREFCRQQQLARNDVAVVLNDLKNGVLAMRTGDDFLFGEPLAADWPLELFLSKWRQRFVGEPDDWTAAPRTWSGYAWADLEPNRIPWAALKSFWRGGDAIPCQNCDRPMILVNFGAPWTGMLRRSPRFVRVCGACRRSILDGSVQDAGAWVNSALDAQVQPEFVMLHDRRVRRAIHGLR